MRKALLIPLLILSSAAFADVASKRAAIHEMLRAIGADAPDDSKTFIAFDRNLTEDDAKQAVAFFRGAAGQHFLTASRDASNVNLRRLDAAIDSSNKKRTLADLRTLAVAVEAYASDNGKPPHAADIDELANAIAPAYLRVVPRIDAWGHAYVYSADGEHYRIASGGKDGKVGTEDDLVFADGELVQPKE